MYEIDTSLARTMHDNLETQILKRCSDPIVVLVYLSSGKLIYGYTAEEVGKLIVSYFKNLYQEDDDESDQTGADQSPINESSLTFNERLTLLLKNSKKLPEATSDPKRRLKAVRSEIAVFKKTKVLSEHLEKFWRILGRLID